MTLNERAAYVQGLFEGYGIDSKEKEGRILSEMLSLISDMADKIGALESECAELRDYIEELDEDLGFVEETILETEDDDEKKDAGDRKLSAGEKRSMIFILLSIVMWFFGYNAATSKYSVYASNVLSRDYNTTLIIAQAAAIISYLPVGMIASAAPGDTVLMDAAPLFVPDSIPRQYMD